MSISSRYLAKLHQLNSAMLVPDHLVMSPDVYHDLQQEGPAYIGTNIYYELEDFNSGLRNSLFGIKIIVDPDLRGDEAFLEIAI